MFLLKTGIELYYLVEEKFVAIHKTINWVFSILKAQTFKHAHSLRSSKWPDCLCYDTIKEDVTVLAWFQNSSPGVFSLCLSLCLSLTHAVKQYTPLHHCRMTHLPLAYLSVLFLISNLLFFIIVCMYSNYVDRASRFTRDSSGITRCPDVPTIHLYMQICSGFSC